MSSIENFPPEVLEIIFAGFKGKYLVEQVMLTCMKFHDVVANSATLMRKIVLRWDSNEILNDEEDLLESPRKYFHILFSRANEITPNITQFINKHSSTIATLDFHDCLFTYDEIRCVLSTVAGTLEKLIYMGTLVLEPAKIQQIKLPKLKTFELSRADEDEIGVLLILSTIATRNLQRFIYFGINVTVEDPLEVEALDTLLRSQHYLAELELPPLHAKAFIKKFLQSPFSLQLKMLRLELHNPTVIQSNKLLFHDGNLAKFIETQKFTLKDLALANCVLNATDIKQVLALGIQKLELSSCKFILTDDIDVDNHSIKSFALHQLGKRDAEDERAICSLLKSCPDLETVKFVYGTVTLEISMILAENLKHLKKLELRNCSIVAIPYPRVEKVDAFRCSRDEIVQLVIMNPQLRSIRLQQQIVQDEILTRVLNRFSSIEVVEFTEEGYRL